MIKLTLSQDIIDFIKDQRNSKSLTANSFAKRIGKTPAYISKFDKGDFKNITLDDLYYLIGSIHYNTDQIEEIPLEEAKSIGEPIVNKFLDEYIENFPHSEEKEYIYYNDEGLNNYDQVYRLLDIPSDLVDFINSTIEKKKISVDDILKRCNSNQDIDASLLKNPKYEYNQYYKDESNDNLFIKFQIEKETLEAILSKEITSSNFISMLMILYTINRLSNNPKFGKKSAQFIALEVLDKFAYRNLSMKRDKNKVEKDRKKILEDFNKLPINTEFTLLQIIHIFNLFASQDLNYTINKAHNVLSNLKEDPSLTISLMEVDLEKTKDLSIDKKRQLIDAINKLVSDFSSTNGDSEIPLL